MQTVDYVVEINRAGLAEINEGGVLVGDLLTLMFLYGWDAEELIDCFPSLTPKMINAALNFASDNRETAEGQFYYSTDPCPLMRALGLI